MQRKAFTLIEMLVVVTIIIGLISILAPSWRRLKFESWLTTQHYILKRNVDEAVMRGAIRKLHHYEAAMRHVEWQIEQVRKRYK